MNRLIMKLNTLHLICALVSPSSLMAQQENYPFRPFAEEGKVWNCQKQVSIPPDWQNVTFHYSYSIAGDTVIGSDTYKKVFRQDEELYKDAEPHYYAALRDGEKGKVYIVKQDAQEPVLLYDFGLEPGEKMLYKAAWADNPQQIFGAYRSTPVDSSKKTQVFTNIRGNPCRVIEVSIYLEPWDYSQSSYPRDWIEEIGNITDPFNQDNWYQFSNELFESCYINGELLMTFDDFGRNTYVVSIDKTLSQLDPPSNLLFDLQGRPLSTPPSRGMYIQNGKKVIK